MEKVEYLLSAVFFLLMPSIIELVIQIKKKNSFGIKFLVFFILLCLSIGIWGFTKLK